MCVNLIYVHCIGEYSIRICEYGFKFAHCPMPFVACVNQHNPNFVYIHAVSQGVGIDFPNCRKTNIAIFAAKRGPIFDAKTIISRDSVVVYSSARSGVVFIITRVMARLREGGCQSPTE